MTIKKNTHIVFYGYYKSFDYYKIGGLESFYRRMASVITEKECKVSFVFYGGTSDYSVEVSENISLKYFKSFKVSLHYLLIEGTLVVDNYILKKHRIRYALFRTKNKNKLKFGHIYAGVPDGIENKIISFLSHKLPSFDGPVLSPSYTIKEKLSKFGINSDVMFPAIPAIYHPLAEDAKDTSGRLALTFIGRFDENKGIKEVISIFKKLSLEGSDVDLCVSGYFAHGVVDKNEIQNAFNEIPNLDIQQKSWEKWSSRMEEEVVELLQKTDILILPYNNLRGTMDPPLLVLEGMACGCLILSTDVGSIKEFYGESPFLLEHDSFVDDAYAIIHEILANKDLLKNEQNRVAEKAKFLQKNIRSVISCLLSDER